MAAAVRRKGEGIALLSMYADEDEEDADMEDEDEDEAMPDAAPEAEPAGVEVVQQQPVPQQEQENRAGNGGAVAVGAGVRRGGRGIVDYAHDEAALSPDPEGREQDSGVSEAGIVYHQLDAGSGVLEEEVRRSPTAAAAVAAGTGSQVEPVEEVDDAGNRGEGLASAGERATEVDAADNGKAGDETSLLDAEGSLDDFLPPPPTGKCSEELQSKFAKYLALKNSGRSFNEDLRNSKGYRNPDFLQRAVRHQEIDQIGSCFKKEVFDPHGYDSGDFYDAISAEQKKELKRKEQEKKQSQRIDFVRGTVASVPAVPDARPKPIVQLLTGQKAFPGAIAAVQSSFRASSSATVVAANGEASVKTEGRSKKTKWDKVDEDKSGVPLPKDALAAATAAAAAASASSARLASTAGSGYSNTWLPKRRETEDKPRSGEKTSSSSKSDRRVDKPGESRRGFE